VVHSISGFDVTMWPASAGLSFAVSNRYTQRGDQPTFWQGYPWASGPVVEPYKTTTLVVEHPQPTAKYEWVLNGHTYRTSSLKIQLRHMGESSVWLRERDAQSLELRRELRMRVVCKYVRRELRALVDTDRESFFDAVELMSLLPTREGQEKFGNDYKEMGYFVKKYGDLVVSPNECSAAHGGPGHLFQHVGMALEFEQTLQVINPALAIPYWDTTIEGHDILTNHNGDLSALWSSQIFDPDWFGSCDNEENAILEGRWAEKLQIPTEQWDSPAHNAYGLARAPWNGNNYPFVQRFHKMLGSTPEELGMKWPTCSIVGDLVAGTHHTEHSWGTFAEELESELLTAPERILGGSASILDSSDIQSYEVVDTFLTAYDADITRRHSADAFAALYRRGMLKCPSEREEGCGSRDNPICTCECDHARLSPALAFDKAALAALFNSVTVGAARPSAADEHLTGKYDDRTKRRVIESICNAQQTSGELWAGAAAPADVLFWPLLPNKEILYHLRHLSPNGMGDDTWPTMETWRVEGEGSEENSGAEGGTPLCEGHNAGDVLPWSLRVLETTSSTGAPNQFTNAQMYEMTNAAGPNYKMPYVYDNFNWDHCIEEGLDLMKIS